MVENMDSTKPFDVGEETKAAPATFITDFSQVPPPRPRQFTFLQDGIKYAISYYPLTFPEVEAVRSSIPDPMPPLKSIEGKGAKELLHMQQEGKPTTYRDFQDTEYLRLKQARQTDLGLEMVRVATRWGRMPTDSDVTPDDLKTDREKFSADVRSRLTAGNYDSLVAEISRHTFTLNPAMLDAFFAASPLSMEPENVL